jgi:hypothetical protein
MFMMLWSFLGFAVLFTLAGPAGADATVSTVSTFAGNPQHTAVYAAPAQDLNAIRWSTAIDLNTSGAFAHFGGPLITAGNTIVVPVKTAANGFLINVFDAADGSAKYSLATDYVLPSHNWIPVYQPALATSSSGTRLYYAGAGGTVYSIDAPDSISHGAPVQQVFYTMLASYRAQAAAFNATVFINTPLTPDGNGNIFFGFRVQGTAPAPLSTTQSGFARIDPSGNATYVLAGTAAGDAAVGRDAQSSAPALSNDQSTLYVIAKGAATESYCYLLGLDATTLATKFKVFLRDPRNQAAATVLDDGTASPMVAPDGDVYFGVYAGNTGSRGFLLHFSGDLTRIKIPGGFGWDNTAAIVPASMAPLYTGASPYLIFTKYNDYAGVGSGGGQGVNRIALLDPNATEIDYHPASNGMSIMREVQTVIGPTADDENRSASLPYAVREWCINTAAVNPATFSVFTPSEDGHLYRWNLASNGLTQFVPLIAGIGEPYTPTVIGPDGTVFTLNGGTLFAIGSLNGVGITLTSSSPNVRNGVSGQSLTLTAKITNTGGSGGIGGFPGGTVTFEDTVYFVPSPNVLSSTTAVLAANVPLDATGHASYTTSALTADTHFITALYSGNAYFSAGSASLIQKIHAAVPVTTLTATPNPSHPGQAVTFTAMLAAGSGTPTGFVTFQEGNTVLAQLPLNASAATAFSTSALAPGNHTITAAYASDSVFAASSGSVVQVIQNPIVTATFSSIAAQDGWVLESVWTSNAGSSLNATASDGGALRVGADASKRQYRSVVSFDTSALPDGAAILAVTLRLRRGMVSGTSPCTASGTCWVDVQSGGFSGSTALQPGDFQAAATAAHAASLTNAVTDGDWSEGSLNAAGRAALDKTGTTQLRVYFSLAGKSLGAAGYIGYYSGESSSPADRPQLVVTYQ